MERFLCLKLRMVMLLLPPLAEGCSSLVDAAVFESVKSELSLEAKSYFVLVLHTPYHHFVVLMHAFTSSNNEHKYMDRYM